MALQDAALFHGILFSSNALTMRSPGQKETQQSLLHLRECIRIVNERLQSASLVVSDSTIAIVSTLAYVEVSSFLPLGIIPADKGQKHAGRPENWQIHMRGLKQMIQQRGGLRKFLSNRVLYNKILR